ncbi:hypothetical protein NC653_027029 [Populus alba x Populus x berolinensis]|uniref:Uncharacterized protein n=1 Tax=Populus alba x Populus x berolinensis TaxID=444605 RepID=A0AAD6M4A7_9ROSI|nr:hypothetical protein NC653_027029 [Populus alba x Populus x berolinensis]
MVEQMHLLTQTMWIVQVLAKSLSQDVFLNHFHSKRVWPWKDLADRAGVFRTGLSKVCCLQLFDTAVERNSSLGCLFSVICHVSHSPVNRWCFIAEDCRKCSSMQLASKGIEFSGGFSPETLDVRSEWMFDPKCLSTLRWCTICDFSRLQSEVNAVEMLL